ncbi:MAG: hypothetical protein WC816_13640 [Sphingomonas sp.]|jgi:hypothetical protein
MRGAALAIAILLAMFAAGLVAVDPQGWPFLLCALALLVGVVFERRRYGAAMGPPPPGPGWRATGERFVDESGDTVRVWYNPADGARRYVKEPSQPGEHHG